MQEQGATPFAGRTPRPPDGLPSSCWRGIECAVSRQTLWSFGMAHRSKQEKVKLGRKKVELDALFVENGRRRPESAIQSTASARRWETAQDLSCIYRELCGGVHEKGTTEVPAAAGHGEDVVVKDLRSKDYQELGQCLQRLVMESIEGLDEFHQIDVEKHREEEGESSAQTPSIFDAASTVLARCAALGDSDQCTSDHDAMWCRRMRSQMDEVVRDVCEGVINFHHIRMALMGSSRAATLDLQDALRDLQGLAKDARAKDDQQGIPGVGDDLVSITVFKDLPRGRIEEAYLRAAIRLAQLQRGEAS